MDVLPVPGPPDMMLMGEVSAVWIGKEYQGNMETVLRKCGVYVENIEGSATVYPAVTLFSNSQPQFDMGIYKQTDWSFIQK